MADCEDVLERLLLGAPLDEAAAAHVRGCARCAREAPAVRAIARTLAAYPVGDPPADLSARVVAAAAPLLARARRPSWGRLAAAIAAALVPLPAIVAGDVLAMRAAYRALSLVLPAALTSYLVFHWAALLALLLGMSYAAIPLLAERQVRLARGETHA
jgi:hypothetical protein